MSFWSALSALAPIGPAQFDAKELLRQRAMQDAAFKQDQALGNARLQEEQQRIRAGNQPAFLQGSRPEWNPVTHTYTQPAWNPETGKIEQMTVPGIDPELISQRSFEDMQKAFKGVTGQEATPEMRDAMFAAAYGFKSPTLYRQNLKPFKLLDGTVRYFDANDPQNIPQGATAVGNGLGMSPYQESLLKLREAEYKLKADPNSVPNKLALLRARSNAVRDQSYALRAQGQFLGTYNGEALPGAVLSDTGQPIGSSFGSQASKLAGQRAQLIDARGSINLVRDALVDLYRTGSSLTNPVVAQALANHEWTAAQIIQGVASQSLTPAEQYAVYTIKSAQENIQGMRKAAGGGLSNEQVNRLEAQIPSAATPNYAAAQTQLNLLDSTIDRLSEGVPNVVGFTPGTGRSGGSTQNNPPKSQTRSSASSNSSAPKTAADYLRSVGVTP